MASGADSTTDGAGEFGINADRKSLLLDAASSSTGTLLHSPSKENLRSATSSSSACFHFTIL